MGIRGRLLTLVLGVAIPLSLVGLTSLWWMWTTSRRQLDDSVEQRAELAAVAFERWVDAQQRPLTTIAGYATERRVLSPALAENLRFTSSQLNSIDLHVLDLNGGTEVAEPPDAMSLPPALVGDLFIEIRRRRLWAVITDWGTGGAERPMLAIGAPVNNGGAVVARVDGAAIRELFRDIELSDGAVLAVFDPRGRILFRSATSQVPIDADARSAPLLAALDNRSKAVIEVASPYDGVRRVYGMARAGTSECVVLIGVPSERLHAPARRQLTRYALFSLLALLCAVVAALILARRIANPLRRVKDAAQRLGAGDLAARAPITGTSEIAELGTAFNQMAAHIEEREIRLTELDRLKSEFVSNVSHELRTPLTTIKTLTRVMLRDGQNEAERRGYLETIAAECDRQIDLVLNLFDLSRIEAGTFKIFTARVDVAEVARACFMSQRQSAEARGLDLRLDLPAELPAVMADYGGLRRVLCGLVDNAIKYTPDGGRITVWARVENDEVAISVTDTGCGISQEDMPHIYEKFYRSHTVAMSGSDKTSDNASDCADVAGVGLGLYLARNIVEQMGGRISVESQVGNGSTFTVFLHVSGDEMDDNEMSEENQNV